MGTTSTNLGTFAVPGGTGTTGLRLNLTGTTFNVKAWDTTSPEPAAWTFSTTQATGVTTNGTARLIVARTAGTGTVVVDNWSQSNPTTPPAPNAVYGYDPITGQLTTETLTGGSRTFGYEFGRLKTFVEALPGLSKNTTLGYDTTGRILTENNAGTVTTYGYDTASQLLSATVGASATVWTYDSLGRRSSEKIGTAAKRTYAYDEASQLCWTSQATVTGTPNCAVPPAGTTTQTYLYDLSGKQTRETISATSKVDYTYDNAGQLATAARLAGTTTTTQTRSYTPDGRLAATVTGAATRTFDWDITGGLTAPLLAYTTTTGTTRDLIGGPTGWAAARTGANPTAIGTDIYGSVVSTTANTTIHRSTTYNAYGTPTGTATFEPKLGYRGELQLDTLLHLRARQYQPGIGQFTTRDPLPGVVGTSTLADPYHYADNIPLQKVDPAGLRAGGPATTDRSFASAQDGPTMFLIFGAPRQDLSKTGALHGDHVLEMMAAAIEAHIDVYLLASIWQAEGPGSEIAPRYIQWLAEELGNRPERYICGASPDCANSGPIRDTRRGSFGMHRAEFVEAKDRALVEHLMGEMEFEDLSDAFINSARAMAWWLRLAGENISRRAVNVYGAAIVSSRNQVPDGAKFLDMSILLAGSHFRGNTAEGVLTLMTQGSRLTDDQLEGFDYGVNALDRMNQWSR